MARYMFLVLVFASGGCLSLPSGESDKTALVSNNPFGVEAPPAATTKASYRPAANDVSERVNKVGWVLLTANPQMGLRPLFATIDNDSLEVFHMNTSILYVTKAVVDRCKTDPELAAVLAAELGKMVAERDARLSPDVRNPEKRPPIQVTMGSGVQSRESDFTALAELGQFESNNPKNSRTPVRPDPTKLARGYLEKAGYQSTDLDAVSTLLQEADRNIALERHFKGIVPQSPWVP
jgi:hypothetical protein